MRYRWVELFGIQGQTIFDSVLGWKVLWRRRLILRIRAVFQRIYSQRCPYHHCFARHCFHPICADSISPSTAQDSRKDSNFERHGGLRRRVAFGSDRAEFSISNHIISSLLLMKMSAVAKPQQNFMNFYNNSPFTLQNSDEIWP